MNVLCLPYRFLILLLAVWILYCHDSTAEELIKSEYSYRKYTAHDGLPETDCRSLYQDSKGYIWVGTFNDFARYDGQNFKIFNQGGDRGIGGFYENAEGEVFGISAGMMHKVCSDNDTVSTHLFLFKAMDRFFHISSGSMPKGYGVICIDDLLTICAFTDTIPTKIWRHEVLEKISVYRNEPYWDRNGRQFLIPTSSGTYVIGEDGVISDSFAVNTINCFIPYKDGFLAVADDGIYEYNNRKLRRILEYQFSTKGLNDFSIIEDPGKGFIISAQNAIFRYYGEKLEIIADNLPMIYDIIIDREGNLWVATAGGVYNFYRLNFRYHNLPSVGNYITSILIDRQNRIFMASTKGDLVYINGDKIMKMDYPKSSNRDTYFNQRAIIEGDNIYICGGGDVLNYNIGNNKFKWLNLPEDVYWNIAPLPNGNLAIGSYETTYIYAPDKGIVRKYDIMETRIVPNHIVTDKRGRLLLGGLDGIVIIDGDSIRRIVDKEIQQCSNVCYDHSGRIWLACKNNLVLMDEDGHFSIVHSFPNKWIRSVHFTKNGVMVVATIDAVYISKNPGNNPQFVRYDQYNGFDILGVFNSSMAEDENGNVWLLTLEGVVQFNPGELLQKQPDPVLYLQTMKSSMDNIGWGNVSREKLPELKYLDNNVKFNYVALCYSATGNIRYQYRLKGFQEEWSNPVSDREVTFNNLPPGRYEFQLKANAGTDDTETDIVSQYFTIYPAFWQTWWFMTLVVLTLLLITTGITINIQRRKNKYLIERLETEKQLNELRVKSIRLRSIPHFNANVLSAIEYYIMNLSKEEANRLLNIYSDFTSRTLREVDKASRSLTDELEYVQLYLKLEKLRFLEKFNYEINIGPEVNKDVQLPNMILHTYCENAVKHGLSSCSSGGLLKISARQKDEDIVEVCVEDNGVGRVAAAQNKNMRSTKQGLDILSRQIEIYNRFNKKQIVQRIDDLFNGDIPCGTRFVIEVPYGFGYQ